MASLRKRGKCWYYRFVDGDGIKREAKGCTDKRVTEELARAAESEAAKVRSGIGDPAAERYAAHEARPVADHLIEYQRGLEAKGGTRKHALLSTRRAERVLTTGKMRRISDLSLSRALNALAVIRDEGLSIETVNHHVRAVKAFSRWLWRDGRAREHALIHLATRNSEDDRRLVRRALSPEESARLIQAAERGPFLMGMTGADRATAYRVALGTGFRAAELSSLTPASFHLDAKPPTIVCEAGYTKNGHEAEQPVSKALAALLRPWVAGRPADGPVFALTARTAEMIRHDLKAAGIDYETGSGVIDFHALRGCYISEPVASGASVKTCQVLARHSTPVLTIGLYAKAALHDVAGAVESLPDLTAPRPEALSATGTDPAPIKKLRAHHLPTGGDGTGGGREGE